MQTPISAPFRLFPIEDYSQVTSKWIDPNQEGYDQPMMDAAIQKRYLEQLWQRLYGRKSPWDEDYVQGILQEDIGACQEKALLKFSNHDKSKQDKWYGMNFRPYASAWIKNIKETIPLDELKKPIFHTAHRAITIQNLSVRILPSQDICLRSIIPGYGYPFDRLQASAAFIGTPVYRIAQTKDKIWSLVIMPDFIAWVPSNGLAYTDDVFIQRWKEAAQDQLIAIIQTQTPLVDTIGRFITQAYVGSVFPASIQKYDAIGRLSLSVPIANEEGKACSVDVIISSAQATYIPMQTSRKNFAKLIDTLQGRDFGWCGTSFYNDCSAELKSLFLPFGIWLPRHSSDQIEISEKIDMNGASPEERLTYLKDYGDPFLTIVYIGGHVLLYIGHFPYKGMSIAMTYQNIWGMADLSDDSVSIIGQSVFFPLLLNYPEDPNLRSLLQRPFFQIAHLKPLPEGYPHLKKPYVVV
ncbi:MAG: SH3 domain-containing protein [Candidatus Cardinium sp.]